MKRTHFSLRSCSSRLSAFAGKAFLAAVAVAAISMAATTLAAAQQPAQRVVQGKVVDGSDAPVKGAVVYLKDDRTLAVKSFISRNDGGYRFGQLAQSTDYELWAESNGKKSGTKTISSFNDKTNITIDLKIK